MKAPKSLKDYPKMLVVNKNQTATTHNKHLLVPYEVNEIVMVAPAEEQKPNHDYDHLFKYTLPTTDAEFKKRYVKIRRKNPENGKWDLTYVINWSSVDLITSLKPTKK